VLAAALVAIVWRAASETAPPPRLRRTLAAFARVPGPAPRLAWPREGQAAIEVEGVGSAGATPAQRPVPIASVAKVMTAYLTLLEHPLAPGQEGFDVTITPAEVAEEGERMALDESVVPVHVGERLSERQALTALMLPSANNVAALLAVHDAGSVPAFLARMNATARALGMRSTRYTDPSGYLDTTVSTAADQLELALAAMRVPAFAAIVDQPSATLPVAGRVRNYDALVGSDGFVGVKTGSDAAAGGCLVFAKRTLVAATPLLVLGVVLGQRAGALIDAALESARRLADSLAAAVRVHTLLASGARALSVEDADGQRTSAATAGALRALGWGGLTVRLALTAVRAGARPRRGQRIARVSARNPLAASTAAVLTRALPGPSLGWRLRHLL